MKSIEFRREREAGWRELETLLQRVERRGLRSLTPEELLRLPNLYRATLSSLSVARSISLDANLLLYLENLAARAYFVVYGAHTPFADAVAAFFGRRFPAAVRRARWHVLAACLFLLLGAAAGFGLTLDNQDRFYAFVPDSYADGRTPTSSTEELRAVLFDREGGWSAALATFATFLFTHNAMVGMFAFALGFALGVPVMLLLFVNGLIVGAFAALYAGRGLSVEFWGWLLIHGTTELLAVALCGGAGLVLGASVAFPGRHDRLTNLAENGRQAGEIVLGAVFMFFVAGLLEGIGRQVIDSTATRYAIAAAALAAWLAYFSVAGRR